MDLTSSATNPSGATGSVAPKHYKIISLISHNNMCKYVTSQLYKCNSILPHRRIRDLKVDMPMQHISLLNSDNAVLPIGKYLSHHP